MSLLSQICSLETQKKLMNRNLSFSIESILIKLKRGEINPNQAQNKIAQLIDPNTKIEQGQTKIIETSVKFVPETETQKDVLGSSISSMFDFHLNLSNRTFVKFESDESSYKSSYKSSFSSSNLTLPTTNWNKISELNNCVVLYRTHSQSRSIEEVFLKAKVPYRLVSGVRFLDRKEIKDVIAILRYVSNGSDKISLSRFLPMVMDGVGAKSLEKILAFLEDSDYPLAPKHQEMIIKLFTNIHTAWSQSKNLIDLCKELQIVTGYSTYLKKEYPNKEEYQERLENIGEIYSLMLPFDQDESMDLTEKLSNFLAQIALMSMVDNTANDPEQPKINLMSLHQSKGLEYETVFLVGCEDGLLPHQNSFLERGEMEEEVRLAYVGITRAMKNLFLISADSRITFGQVRSNPASRIFRPFLDKYCIRVK
jgi:superfamily I DNA/RNA helicase